IPLSMNMEEDALALRAYLGLPSHGPVGSLIELLENRGVLVCQVDSECEGFRGANGLVNDRPYVVINRHMTAERIRTTICHEIAHFAFLWPHEMDDKKIEKMATAIAGAFLFPKEDAFRELGLHRSSITTDMFMVCREYGISMSLLTLRSWQVGIISQSTYRNFYASRGDVKSDTVLNEEVPTLFEQLVYRAVNENDISIQKGAELLKLPYDTVASNCRILGA
ncbi:MAG: ImmA/IrrE family metallo-endopeptidase, partial [Spirochaetales bacterium]|nr:ImmA/IrrE family metallo-endopeptidase [Candidatus Physcosoma equi]